jgi:anthranilate synthase/aminodeoxychorismate synthase-like glutamine amidotransferase
MSRLLLIDNYDSFTYNLYQYLCELGAGVDVRRNDSLTVEDVAALQPEGIVLSPGPGRPEDAGICIEVIQRFAGKVPLLGVCLGHQAIAAAYGAQIVGAPELLHGKTSLIHHDSGGLYRGLPTPFRAVRYHSLVADRSTLPNSLIIDAETADGTIMGLRHREIPLYGVQFHPESILTDVGKQLLQNYLDVVAASTATPVAVASSIPAASSSAPAGR